MITREQAIQIASQAGLETFFKTAHESALMTAGSLDNFTRALNLAHQDGQRSLELTPDGKEVMRIERDRILVDPDVEVTEAARVVLAALEDQIKVLAQKAHQDGQRAMRERAAKMVRTCGTWAIDRGIQSLEIE